MNAFVSRLNRRSSVSTAAVIISLAYLASRLLGLLRDRLLVSHFGIGPLADAYTAAFRIPELLFTLLVSGAFAVAFIPVLSQRLENEDKEGAWVLASSLLNLLGAASIVVGIAAFTLADPLTSLIAPGFDPDRHQLTVQLTRIMLVTPLLFAVSSVLGSVAQSFGRFVFFALSSVLYNIGIIFGIVFLSPSHSIFGVAEGVVLGAFLQAVLQIAGLAGLGFKYRLNFKFKDAGVRKVLGLMIPRSIDQGIDQLNYMVETVIGSRLAAGSLASLYYANNLKNVPLVLIGNSIATAAFPRMAARAAKGAVENLIHDFVTNARMILFLVVPAAAVTIIMRGYIVRLLYGFGDQTTANTLGWFAGVIVFQAFFFLISRVYYAMQDTRTPLYVSMVAIFLNIPLSFILSGRYGVVGLAMAQSVVAAIEAVALTIILRGRLGNIGLRLIGHGLSKMLLAGGIMAGVLYVAVSRLLPLYRADIGFPVVAPKFAALCLIAAVAYIIPCYLMHLKEARQGAAKLKEQVLRPLNLT
ncbi:MAG TPA: murein biosynthesis integral membrane protein MurJ [Candidatus Saccharimonadales bacterium]|nr:murein biosynthesis integral membrane protein MurJ [Candidatus Saccharimonadales bacterium]